MISHKHRCIFIHIAKCAGTTIESAFGVDVTNYNAEENNFLFGWDKKNLLWLQHATPQQLLDYDYISRDVWERYYKFIIYRNSWSRAISDYFWISKTHGLNDSFKNFITKSGKFSKKMNDKSTSYYSGDHLNLQKDYFFLDGTLIKYDNVIDFDYLDMGLNKLIKDLSLNNDFFNQKLNQSLSLNKQHYSLFYNNKMKKLVENTYKEDIDFFDFKFEEKKSSSQKLSMDLKSYLK